MDIKLIIVALVIGTASAVPIPKANPEPSANPGGYYNRDQSYGGYHYSHAHQGGFYNQYHKQPTTVQVQKSIEVGNYDIPENIGYWPGSSFSYQQPPTSYSNGYQQNGYAANYQPSSSAFQGSRQNAAFSQASNLNSNLGSSQQIIPALAASSFQTAAARASGNSGTKTFTVTISENTGAPDNVQSSPPGQFTPNGGQYSMSVA